MEDTLKNPGWRVATMELSMPGASLGRGELDVKVPTYSNNLDWGTLLPHPFNFVKLVSRKSGLKPRDTGSKAEPLEGLWWYIVGGKARRITEC